MNPRAVQTLLLVAITAFVGCNSETKHVVVYTALDQGFSEPVFDSFTEETGIQVHAKFDVESTKTVGLVNALIAEREHPRCDVFWNNELLHTLRLRKLGLLDVYVSKNGKAFPSQYRAGDHSWYGFAGRARVLIVNTKRVAKDKMPSSIYDLIDKKWKGQVGVAKPLFGTTATHAAVLFDKWGANQAQDFFRRLKANAKVMSGNKGVAQAVAAGRLAFGITDTDDAIIERDDGQPVKIVFPDQGKDQMGTLMIPNSLAILRSCPNRENAIRLIEYLLAEKMERRLSKGNSAQFPLNPSVKETPRVMPDPEPRWANVNFESAADKWKDSAMFLRELFNRAD